MPPSPPAAGEVGYWTRGPQWDQKGGRRTLPADPRALTTRRRWGSPQSAPVSRGSQPRPGGRTCRAWELWAGQRQVVGLQTLGPDPQRAQAGNGEGRPRRSGTRDRASARTARGHSPPPPASGPLALQPLCSLAESPGRPPRAFPRGRTAGPRPGAAGAARRGHLPGLCRPAIPQASPKLCRAGAVPDAAGGPGHLPTHATLRPFSTNKKAKPEVGIHSEGHGFASKPRASFLCLGLLLMTTIFLGKASSTIRKVPFSVLLAPIVHRALGAEIQRRIPPAGTS